MSKRASKTREHILEVASRLFYQHGIRAVGVDAIVAEASVAKMTLYNHFRSKDDLIVAYLEREKQKWLQFTDDRREVQSIGSGEDLILRTFDTFNAMLKDPAFDFRGCPLINICAEIPDNNHPARKIAWEFNEILCQRIQDWARDAGLKNPELMGTTILCLLYGTLTKSHISGNTNIALDAKAGAKMLMENGRSSSQ